MLVGFKLANDQVDLIVSLFLELLQWKRSIIADLCGRSDKAGHYLRVGQSSGGSTEREPTLITINVTYHFSVFNAVNIIVES